MHHSLVGLVAGATDIWLWWGSEKHSIIQDKSHSTTKNFRNLDDHGNCVLLEHCCESVIDVTRRATGWLPDDINKGIEG